VRWSATSPSPPQVNSPDACKPRSNEELTRRLVELRWYLPPAVATVVRVHCQAPVIELVVAPVDVGDQNYLDNAAGLYVALIDDDERTVHDDVGAEHAFDLGGDFMQLLWEENFHRHDLRDDAKVAGSDVRESVVPIIGPPAILVPDLHPVIPWEHGIQIVFPVVDRTARERQQRLCFRSDLPRTDVMVILTEVW
jgi:hypothetical protein